ncbi:diguanylate cyclase [Vreelandella rituensis]|uniref:GGDEF domain-containing protein n=1 Tax=Vreelandella rituensis TaxID=2282306 RepID=UPI002287436E|nr:diguanylate cyclase [Halomonas rituensis]
MQHERELKRVANKDMFTGLVNRMSFDQRLEKEIERTRRYERLLLLIVLDIDHFKPINDEHGHDVDDQVLVHSPRTCALPIYARAGPVRSSWWWGITSSFCVAEAGPNELAAGVIKRSIRPREKAATG